MAPQASACSLLDSQVPRASPSACSCRNGVAPAAAGRNPERDTRRGTGRSRTYVPDPERPSTSPSAISTLRASSATVSETPYSSRIRACEGSRVWGGQLAVDDLLAEITRDAQIRRLLTECHWPLPSGCTDSNSLATVGCAMQAKARESLDVMISARRGLYPGTFSPL